MFSALPKLVALVLLCGLCSCHSARPITAASVKGPASPASAKKSIDLATRNNALLLLRDLLDDESKLRLILLIKRESPELNRLVKGISSAAAEGAEMLKARTKDDPAFKDANLQLPPGEEATRKAIAKTKQSLLLHTHGEEFEFQMLLTQAEALGYGTHLALVASENEPDAHLPSSCPISPPNSNVSPGRSSPSSGRNRSRAEGVSGSQARRPKRGGNWGQDNGSECLPSPDSCPVPVVPFLRLWSGLRIRASARWDRRLGAGHDPFS